MKKQPNILVIADDFTGAAEVAGVAYRLGLKARLHWVATTLGPGSYAVNVISTNSRLMPPAKAYETLRNTVAHIPWDEYDLVFKKIDSVLRGAILAELDAIMEVSNIRRAMIIPANPSKNRIIREGRYFIDEVPLEQTDFANDPQHPRQTNVVGSLIESWQDISVYTGDGAFSENISSGVLVPNITSTKDIEELATMSLGQPWILAGGADFFRAILRTGYGLNIQPTAMAIADNQAPKLFVIGSITEQSKNTIRSLQETGWVHYELTGEDLQKGYVAEEEITNLVSGLRKNGQGFIARPSQHLSDTAARLRVSKVLADAAAALIRRLPSREIYVEGGETAFQLVKALRLDHLGVLSASEAGVVQLRSKEKSFSLTVKPGSYHWPTQLLTAIAS